MRKAKLEESTVKNAKGTPKKAEKAFKPMKIGTIKSDWVTTIKIIF